MYTLYTQRKIIRKLDLLSGNLYLTLLSPCQNEVVLTIMFLLTSARDFVCVDPNYKRDCVKNIETYKL